MFLALVFLLVATKPHSVSARVRTIAPPPPITSIGPVWISSVLDGRGKVTWRSHDHPSESDAKLMRLATSGSVSDRWVVVHSDAPNDERPTVAFLQDLQVLPSESTKSIPEGSGSSRGWTFIAKAPADGLNGSPLHLGIATAAWQTIGEVPMSKDGMGPRSGQGFARMVRPDDSQHSKGKQDLVVVDASLPTDVAMSAYRVQVLDKNGNPMPAQRETSSPKDSSERSFWFTGKYGEVGRIELQKRPYVVLTVPRS